MAQYRIAVIVGSLRKESFNRQLAEGLVKLAPPEFDLVISEIRDLPLYDQDDDNQPADSVKRFKNEIRESNGLLFVTPEYNRSMPGVLKNAIDHASRPYGHSVWSNKPAGIVGVSIGAIGTAMAQQHLRNVLSYLNVPTLGQPEIYMQAKDGKVDVSPENIFLRDFMNRFVEWVKQHQVSA